MPTDGAAAAGKPALLLVKLCKEKGSFPCQDAQAADGSCVVSTVNSLILSVCGWVVTWGLPGTKDRGSYPAEPFVRKTG